MPGEPVECGAHRIARVERRGIGPALGERVRHVVDGRSVQLELQVVPRRPCAVVLVVELHGLRIAEVPGVVTSAMAEVDPADERDVGGGIGAPHDDELLVVAAAVADALVEQHLTAGLVHDARERQVLSLAEVHRLRVRPPEQAPHVHAATGQLGDHVADRGPGTGELLVGITLPVGEVQPVAGAGRAQHLVQAGEVLGAVDQHPAVVALGPGGSTVAAVELGGLVAPLGRVEEPVVQRHAPEATGSRRARVRRPGAPRPCARPWARTRRRALPRAGRRAPHRTGRRSTTAAPRAGSRSFRPVVHRSG